eukprot:TRINITY_DN76793_c0_g1_i1.p1 TRINITY_DN76793_c0_g1~~TRINITY_DN76793_c0_g1_i1.p1  ORF type:complete len:595 (-),score=117.51 TRINITY_DN76793_c0_g1_i1:94-1878(-)
MNFVSYVALSTLVVFGVVAHAYVVHEQFYPAVVYLSTDKMCLAVMYNFAFAVFLLFGKMILRLFIGTLRDVEVEQLVDSGRGFLADTILFLVFYAPTIDNREVGTVFLIQYICCVIFMKVFHLTTQIRVSHMFEVGVPRLIVNIKLVALMALLLGCDLVVLNYFYGVASRSSTFFTWILFEALTMSIVVLVSMCKYSIHMVDLRLENGWPAKSVCLFYVDLINDVVSMTLFLIFMLTFFVQNPSRLPIYMMADVIQVARKLAQRLRSFRRYRRISNNMDLRFPDATDEEIEENEHCVICRDSLFEGSRPKKLPCGHIFHIDCLKSWLVMQQVCPTCRAEIPADGPLLNQNHQREDTGLAAAQAAAAAARANTPSAPAQSPPAVGGAGSTSAQRAAAPAASSSAASAPTQQAGADAAGAAPGSAAAAVAAAFTSVASGSQAASSSGAGSGGVDAARLGSIFLPSGGAAFRVPGSSAGAAGGALPPLQDILDSLKRAEEVAQYLREQQDFWMGQVRQIQERHGREAASARGAAPSASAPSAASAEPTPPAATSEIGGSPEDQMAELRRVRSEQWARKRTQSQLSEAEAEAAAPPPS